MAKLNEKRFIFNGIEIEDNKKGIEYNTFMKEGCEKIANQLNELVDENEKLRKQVAEYEEVQCKIMNYIIDKGLGSEFAKFLREAEDE